MQSFSFPVSGKIIARATGAALVASLMAGCTTDSLRLQDTMTTGSVANAGAPVPPAGVGGGAYAAANTGYGTNDYGNGGLGNGTAGGQAYQPQPAQTASDNRYALAPTTYGASAVEQRSLDAPSATGNVAQSAPTYQPQQQASLAPAAQAPAATTQSAGGNRVTLEPNETLYSVARRYGVPTDALMKANGITDATSVSVGQQLVIPSFSNGGWSAQPAGSQQPATRTAAASAGGSYTVQSGDTLSSISRKTGVSLSALRSANSISGDVIRVGQTLSLGGAGQQATQVAAVNTQTATDATQSAPAQPVTSVQQQPAQQQQTETAAAPASQNQPTGYTAPSAAGSEQTSDVGAVAQTEQAALVPESTGIGKLRWPARGRVLTAYGATDGGVRNDGIDISVPEGSEVKAAENGVVIYAGSGLKEFGNTVLVRHDNGLVTVYGHASEIKVSRGDKVQRGQVIASSGMSGSAKQPKLHFEVRENAAPVDPTSFLE